MSTNTQLKENVGFQGTLPVDVVAPSFPAAWGTGGARVGHEICRSRDALAICRSSQGYTLICDEAPGGRR